MDQAFVAAERDATSGRAFSLLVGLDRPTQRAILRGRALLARYSAHSSSSTHSGITPHMVGLQLGALVNGVQSGLYASSVWRPPHDDDAASTPTHPTGRKRGLAMPPPSPVPSRLRPEEDDDDANVDDDDDDEEEEGAPSLSEGVARKKGTQFLKTMIDEGVLSFQYPLPPTLLALPNAVVAAEWNRLGKPTAYSKESDTFCRFCVWTMSDMFLYNPAVGAPFSLVPCSVGDPGLTRWVAQNPRPTNGSEFSTLVVSGLYRAYHRTFFQMGADAPLPDRLTLAIEGGKGTIFRGIIRFIPEHLLCSNLLRFFSAHFPHPHNLRLLRKGAVLEPTAAQTLLQAEQEVRDDALPLAEALWLDGSGGRDAPKKKKKSKTGPPPLLGPGGKKWFTGTFSRALRMVHLREALTNPLFNGQLEELLGRFHLVFPPDSRMRAAALRMGESTVFTAILRSIHRHHGVPTKDLQALHPLLLHAVGRDAPSGHAASTLPVLRALWKAHPEHRAALDLALDEHIAAAMREHPEWCLV